MVDHNDGVNGGYDDDDSDGGDGALMHREDDEEVDAPDLIPQRPPIPIINMPPNPPDHEYPEDPAWDWLQEDDGAIVEDFDSPSAGTSLLDPSLSEPEDFFNALFDDRMWTIIANRTNEFGNRRKHGR